MTSAGTGGIRVDRVFYVASSGLLCASRKTAGGFRLKTGRGVAQSGSAPALGAGGPEFESRRPDHIPQFFAKSRRTELLPVSVCMDRRVPSLGDAEGSRSRLMTGGNERPIMRCVVRR